MNAPPEANIPLLTEVIHLPQAQEQAPENAAATPKAAATTAPPTGPAAATRTSETHKSDSDAIPAHAMVTWGEREWDLLQRKLSERILRQLQGRIDFVLEQRVRDSLADVLQVAMAGLTHEIKRGLQHTMEDVIGRAVAQEIARLQTLKK